MTKKHESLMIFNCTLSSLIDILCSKWLLFETTKHVDFQGQCEVQIGIFSQLSIRIYILARRNSLWDILRLPSSRRAALGLYVILTL